MFLKWHQDESFQMPKGLIRHKNFLVWKKHPWTDEKIPFPKKSCSESWTKTCPKTVRDKESLAKVCPEGFLIFQLVALKTWGPNTWKVKPLMPIVRKLPAALRDAILNDDDYQLTSKEYKEHIRISCRGLNSEYACLQNHEYEYVPTEKLLEIVEIIGERLRNDGRLLKRKKGKDEPQSHEKKKTVYFI